MHLPHVGDCKVHGSFVSPDGVCPECDGRWRGRTWKDAPLLAATAAVVAAYGLDTENGGWLGPDAPNDMPTLLCLALSVPALVVSLTWFAFWGAQGLTGRHRVAWSIALAIAGSVWVWIHHR